MGFIDPPRARENNIDLIRFALATTVILSHSYYLTSGHEEGQPLSWLTRGQTDAGKLAVDGFFILSGFLISQSWEHCRGFLDFLWRRVRRIYPAFVVCAAICVYGLGPFFSSATRHDQLRMMARSFTLAAIQLPSSFAHNPAPGMNGSTWTIRPEFQCYLIVPVLGLIAALAAGRRRAVVSSVLVVVLVLRLLEAIGGVAVALAPVRAALHLLQRGGAGTRFLSTFLSGACFYAWREGIPHRTGIAVAGAIAVAAGCAAPPLLAVLVPTAGTYVLMWVAFNRRVTFARFARYGDFSYGIYLYAWPIQQLLAGPGGVRHSLVLFALAAVLSVLAGAASWYAVERWFLVKRRARTARRDISAGEVRQPDPDLVAP